LATIARFARREEGKWFIFFGQSPKKMNHLSSFCERGEQKEFLQESPTNNGQSSHTVPFIVFLHAP
jgi:hypothetical protein